MKVSNLEAKMDQWARGQINLSEMEELVADDITCCHSLSKRPIKGKEAVMLSLFLIGNKIRPCKIHGELRRMGDEYIILETYRIGVTDIQSISRITINKAGQIDLYISYVSPALVVLEAIEYMANTPQPDSVLYSK